MVLRRLDQGVPPPAVEQCELDAEPDRWRAKKSLLDVISQASSSGSEELVLLHEPELGLWSLQARPDAGAN